MQMPNLFTEETVFSRLTAAFPTASIIATVQRMSLLHHFDTVILIDHSRVRDIGSVAERLEHQPVFREILKHHDQPPVGTMAPAGHCARPAGSQPAARR